MKEGADQDFTGPGIIQFEGGESFKKNNTKSWTYNEVGPWEEPV